MSNQLINEIRKREFSTRSACVYTFHRSLNKICFALSQCGRNSQGLYTKNVFCCWKTDFYR